MGFKTINWKITKHNWSKFQFNSVYQSLVHQIYGYKWDLINFLINKQIQYGFGSHIRYINLTYSN